jgi:hypothetical protein
MDPNSGDCGETNACGFWSNENRSPTNGIRATGLEFETHPTCVGGEIVGHWVQRFPRVSRHGLTPSRGS